MAGPERTRAVIFDLWDTLVPLPARVRSAAIECMAQALDLPVVTFGEAWAASWTRRATGPIEPIVADIYRELTGRAASEERIANALRRRHEVHASAFVPTAAAVETLRLLRAEGFRIGLLTNCTSDTPNLWHASPLAPLVDGAAFSAREGVMKPEPSFYLLLLARLGVEPAGCVYVGDGMDDELEGAERVGLEPILYAPHGASSSWPGATIRFLDEAPELVRAMATNSLLRGR
jgi:putative hydrolase of the HAD superfamily